MRLPLLSLRLFATIFLTYVTLLIVQPLASFIAQVTCCHQEQSQETGKCCPDGVCNPFEQCACCPGVTISQETFDLTKMDFAIVIVSAHYQGAVSTYSSDFFHPPNFI